MAWIEINDGLSSTANRGYMLGPVELRENFSYLAFLGYTLQTTFAF